MSIEKKIYWIFTVIMSLLFFSGAVMYIFNYQRAHDFFVSLGFPVWIIYPLASAKILGVIAILTKYSSFLKELAYAGFLYNSILALAAHIMVRDGEYIPAIVAIIVVCISWRYDKKISVSN